MASIEAQAPDGATLNIDVPDGTDPSHYAGMVDDAVQHYTSTMQSPLESAGRGALRNFPLAQQAAAAVAPWNPLSKEKTYGAELQHLTEAAEQGKEQNPKAYYTGATAGTIAPMAIPFAGGALKLAGPALEAAEVAGGAGALGGGLNAAAQSLSDTNLTDMKGKDYANAGISAALGATLGKMFGGAKAGAKAAPAIAEAAPAVEAVAPKIIPKAAKEVAPDVLQSVAGSAIPPAPLGAVSHKPVAADFTPPPERLSASLVAQGLGGTPRQQMKLYIGKDPVVALNEIGSWMKTADSGKSIAGIMDRPGELLRKVENIHSSAGKSIGDMIDNIAPGARVDGGELSFKLDHLLDETYDASAEHAIEKLQQQLQKAELSGRLDFQALQKIKSSFGKTAKTSGHDAAGSSIKQAYGVLAQYMNDVVDQFGARVKDPSALANYNKAKLDYRNTSNLLPILRYQEAKELIGGPAGHTTLIGLLGKVAKEVSEAVGVPSPQQIIKNSFLSAGAAMSPAAPVVAPAAGQAVAAAAPKVVPGVGKRLSQAAQLELANALSTKFRGK